MIRINREKLNRVVDALMECAEDARNIEGLRIVFPLTRERAEAGILGALSILYPTISPGGNAVTSDDTYFISGFGTDQRVQFPPKSMKASA